VGTAYPSALNDAEGMARSLEIIKAQMAEELYKKGSYFELYGAKYDNILHKAIEVIQAQQP
jgi:hypothetical protein